MAKIFYKVSKNEETNLKWLLNRIFFNTQCGRRCYILSSSIVKYADIFEEYNRTYNTVCPASIFSDKVDLKSGDFLCVNDLLGNTDCNILQVIKDSSEKCDYIYITLVGNQADYVDIRGDMK